MSRNNTGNPIDSKAYADFEDNVANFDQWSISEADSFKDRKGEERLTLKGTERAGAGDTGVAVDAAARAVAAAGQVEENAEQIAQDAAQQAVGNVVTAVDGAVDRAEVAADKAETAADAAFVSADVYPSWEAGVAGTVAPQQFQVIAANGLYIIRYQRTSSGAVEVAQYPAAQSAALMNMTMGVLYAAQGLVQVDANEETLTLSGGRVVAGSRSVLLQATSISYGSSAEFSFILIVDLDSGAASLIPVISTKEIPMNYVAVAHFNRVLGILSGLPGGHLLNNIGVLGESFRTGSLFAASRSGIFVDPNAKTIRINSARLSTEGGSTNISGEQIEYDETLPLQYLVYSANDGLKLIAPGNVGQLSASDILISPFETASGRLPWVLSKYQVNGLESGALNAGMALSVPDRLDFSFDSLKIKITGSIPTTYGAARYLIAPQEVDISGVPTHLWRVLVLNPASGAVEHIASNIEFNQSFVVLGAFKIDEQFVRGFEHYSINGVPAGGLTPTPEPPSALFLGWDVDLGFAAPGVSGYSVTDPIPLNTINSAMIYSWFDQLMAENPDYITRTLLGNEPGAGLPVYEYRFSPETPNLGAEGSDRPRIFIQGGIHNERGSWVYPFELMKCITNEWGSSPELEALRFGVEISVIPAVSPWGVDNNSYVNFNGVNINRNYPVGWLYSDLPNQGSGPEPLSEIETQCSYGLLQDFRPHIFIDCHDFGAGREDRAAWYPSSDPVYRAAAEAMATRMVLKWRSQESWIPSLPEFAQIGPSGVGGVSNKTGHSLGIISGTHEFAQSIYQDPVLKRGSQFVIQCAVESLGNLIVAILRKIS